MTWFFKKNTIFNYMLLSFLILSCNTPSKFNLEKDHANFKTELKEKDTLYLFFNHSLCEDDGIEKLEITKFRDSIRIKSFYQKVFSNKWELIYNKKIAQTNTIWNLDELLKKNSFRKNIKNNYPTMVLQHHSNKLNFFTKDLLDLNRFSKEYFNVMRTIYPENKEAFYGVDLIKLDSIGFKNKVSVDKN